VTDEQPVGYLKGAMDLNDHQLRWKISGAVIEHAKNLIDRNDEGGTIGPEDAMRAIWEWETVGEVFARYLIFGLKVSPESSDEAILEDVARSWDHIMGGMPDRE
jgi:hypothetical protein